jgi:electron transport complex protein RnfB
VLPQTQCTKCGFDGCRPYAEAIASGAAQIDRCPPGGAAGIARLARLLGRPTLPLDPQRGVEGPRRLAWIDPDLCIGCTKCIQACPVDAIIGGQRRMHTVVAKLCTGCDLCVAPCPVDCIEMRPLAAGDAQGRWSDSDANAARNRHLARRARLEREGARREHSLTERAMVSVDEASVNEASVDAEAARRKRAIIDSAVQRARQRLVAAGFESGSGR